MRVLTAVSASSLDWRSPTHWEYNSSSQIFYNRVQKSALIPSYVRRLPYLSLCALPSSQVIVLTFQHSDQQALWFHLAWTKAFGDLSILPRDPPHSNEDPYSCFLSLRRIQLWESQSLIELAWDFTPFTSFLLLLELTRSALFQVISSIRWYASRH